MEYIGNCTHLNGDDISDMVDESEPITASEFKRNVKSPISIYDQSFGGYSKDYCVSFYKSKFKGKLCYYTCHSGIEFVYT